MPSPVKSETPRQWAKKRRKIFTSPVKDVLSAFVVAGATGVYRYRAGDPNWQIAVTASVIAVAAAFVLPQLETLFWFAARKWVLFDETQAELEALRARAGEVSAEMQRAENTENLLRRLGNLRLSYIQLERAFLAKDGAKELWPSQTKLHNTAAGIIDLELGRDYWSDFKDVKSSPPESVIPKSFPRDDHEVMNLLYMIHGRSEWIGKIVQGIRAGSVVPKRLPVETGPPDSQRVTDMRVLLREAAAHVSAMPKKLGDSRSAAEMAFMLMETIPELLNRAFLSPPTENFKSFMSAERDKQGDNPDPGIAAAAFLNRLADGLTGDNLDEGFLMPQSFEQFVAADSGRSS